MSMQLRIPTIDNKVVFLSIPARLAILITRVVSLSKKIILVWIKWMLISCYITTLRRRSKFFFFHSLHFQGENNIFGFKRA